MPESPAKRFQQRYGPTVARRREQLADLTEWLRPGFVGLLLERLYEVEFLDRTVALASKAFISFFPFLLAVTVVMPKRLRLDLVQSLRERFGLSGDAYKLVSDAFANIQSFRSATGVLSIVLLLFYATSFTTSLQRVYLRTWRRPASGGGPRNAGRGLLVVAGILATMTVSGGLGRIVFGIPGKTLIVVVQILITFFVWWTVHWLMLRGEFYWRALLPPAVITAVLALGNTVAAGIWMPRSVVSNQKQFGYFGVTLSIVSWFVSLSFCIIVGAASGPVLAEREDWIGRWMRGPHGSVLKPGAPPSRPAPARTPNILDAFGRRGAAPDTAGDEEDALKPD